MNEIIVAAVERLAERVNELEVKLDGLLAEYEVHGHGNLLEHQPGCEHGNV